MNWSAVVEVFSPTQSPAAFFLRNNVELSLQPLASHQVCKAGQSSQTSRNRIIAANRILLGNEKPKQLVCNLYHTSGCVWSQSPWIQAGCSVPGLARQSGGIPWYWWRLTGAHTRMPGDTASLSFCVSLSSPSHPALSCLHPTDS